MSVIVIATRSTMIIVRCADRAWHDPLRPVPGWTNRGDDRAEGSSVLHRNPGSSGAEIQTEPPTSAVQRICGSCFESKKINHNKKAAVRRFSRLATAFLCTYANSFSMSLLEPFKDPCTISGFPPPFPLNASLSFFANSLTSVELLPMIYR